MAELEKKVKNQYFMLKYAIEEIKDLVNDAEFASGFCNKTKFFGQMFIEHYKSLDIIDNVAYRTVVEKGETPKGHIEIEKSIDSGLIDTPNIIYSYGVRSNDTVENRIIKSALLSIKNMVTDDYEISNNLENVIAMNYGSVLDIELYEASEEINIGIVYDDLDKAKQRELNLAITYIKCESLSNDRSTNDHGGLDEERMSKVFECFLRGYFREERGCGHRSIFDGKLIYPRSETDITIDEAGVYRDSFILDAKWTTSEFKNIKKTDEYRIKAEYEYQIMAYCTKFKDRAYKQKHNDINVVGVIVHAVFFDGLPDDFCEYVNNTEPKLFYNNKCCYFQWMLDMTKDEATIIQGLKDLENKYSSEMNNLKKGA